MFKVEQKVHCKTYGEGVVVDVSGDVDETYPVAVEFASGEWDFIWKTVSYAIWMMYQACL